MNVKKLLIFFLIILLPISLWADPVRGRLNLAEEDGSPSVFPYKIKVTNGTLTDNEDGTASLANVGAEVDTLDTVSDRGSTTDQALTTGGVVVGDGQTVGAATNKWLFDDTNGDISTTGNVGIGTVGPDGKLDVVGGALNTLNVDSYDTNDGQAGRVRVRKSSSATVGTKSATVDEELLGSYMIMGVDSDSAFSTAASITAVQVGNVSSGRVPSRLEFKVADTAGNIGTPVMVVDGPTRNVGIGTTAPGAKLEIGQSSDVFTQGISIINAAENRQGVMYVNGLTFVVNSKTDGTGDLALNEGGGNVGIGTTSPQGKLDITSTDATPSLMVRGTTAANNAAYFTSAGYGPVIGTEGTSDSYYSFAVYSGVTPTSGGFTGGTQRFVVKDSGKVGIGTTDPDVNLDVEGTTGISIGEDVAGGTTNEEGILRLWSDGDNAFSTTIKTGVQTQDITLTLPLDDGDAGQALTTDGAGVLSWSASGSGDMLVATYDPAGIAEQLVGLIATQTLTNKTLATPTITTKATCPEIEYTGDITIDAINAAANSTVTITNSDVTYVANLSVEGTIAGSNLSGTNTGDDDVPEAGDFGNATDLDANGAILADAVNDDAISNSADVMSGSFGITIDGGGSAITTGIKGYIEIPYAMTIDRATVLLDQSGSIVIDVWKDTYANYPPVDADTITSTTPPTVTTATKSEDTTLTSWTTSVAAGDIIGFNVDSITTATRAHLIISGNKL